jgi:hypothetical protein
MAGPASAGVDEVGIAPVGFADGAAQVVGWFFALTLVAMIEEGVPWQAAESDSIHSSQSGGGFAAHSSQPAHRDETAMNRAQMYLVRILVNDG